MVKANHALSNSALGNHPWHNFVWCETGWICSVNDRCVTAKIQQTEKKKETDRSPLHCLSRWRRVKTDLILTIVTYRTDVNHSWAPERKTNNHNVRFPVTRGCFLTKNSAPMLLVLQCRSASNFSPTYHCLNVQVMIKMMRIGIWVLILGLQG